VITVGSLFAGIGGIELGLERTGGFRTVWQVEIDDYARRVLEKHWPDVRRWGDVRTFPPEPVDEWRCDFICGGFPCTNISSSGNCKGLAGEESGLWFEMLRIVRVLRPRFIVVENVADIVYRGLGDVLAGLAEAGFDAEWQCLPAAAFGSPQRRDRMFVVAYPSRSGLTVNEEHHRRAKADLAKEPKTNWNHIDGLALAEYRTKAAASVVRRMDDAVPNRVDRLRCLGNAVVPQVAEWIGRQILAAEDQP